MGRGRDEGRHSEEVQGRLREVYRVGRCHAVAARRRDGVPLRVPRAGGQRREAVGAVGRQSLRRVRRRRLVLRRRSRPRPRIPPRLQNHPPLRALLHGRARGATRGLPRRHRHLRLRRGVLVPQVQVHEGAVRQSRRRTRLRRRRPRRQHRAQHHQRGPRRRRRRGWPQRVVGEDGRGERAGVLGVRRPGAAGGVPGEHEE
mmetsp:Transcript_5920/g.14415  ORF Transcript_5920/g.14415 Transcript_5920/m.14415 type:complete len:201 (+) Transcript_5920:224-826(+)